eukprot:TRINITY_DN10214_c0_g2_i1.p1 TRINITY_DN10214_c0_g2~~TRINITY_DN10214_c0_g2_i1.p1  ORF type:complete len:161 (-),score=23.75 TRINITY_DN10214_c0_g2_i1:38-520(-)
MKKSITVWKPVSPRHPLVDIAGETQKGIMAVSLRTLPPSPNSLKPICADLQMKKTQAGPLKSVYQRDDRSRNPKLCTDAAISDAHYSLSDSSTDLEIPLFIDILAEPICDFSEKNANAGTPLLHELQNQASSPLSLVSMMMASSSTSHMMGNAKETQQGE